LTAYVDEEPPINQESSLEVLLPISS